MIVTVRNPFSILHCNLKQSILVYTWLGGLVLGAIFSVSADELLFSTMHAAVSGSMSISGLIVVTLLPLLLTAYAVYFSQPVFLVFIVFLKAFLLTYTGAGLLITYPVSGWLMQCLLMFSELVILPLLWFVWLCAISEPQKKTLRLIVACAIWSVLAGCVNFTTIAPFLARLI